CRCSPGAVAARSLLYVYVCWVRICGGSIVCRSVLRPYSRCMQVGQAKRIGVFGGAFDPIHNGHLVAGSEGAYAPSLSEVVFVTTGQPGQKENRDLAPAEDRYLMTVNATASDPLIAVSRVDIDRPGETYTVDTLTDLHAARGPDAEFFFIMGADALAS